MKFFIFFLGSLFFVNCSIANEGYDFAVKDSLKRMKDKSALELEGIHKGFIQMDVNFNFGSHYAFTGKKTDSLSLKSYQLGFRPGMLLNFDVAAHPFFSVGVFIGYDAGNRQAGIGVGGRGVLHLYQMIYQKKQTKIHPAKLDVYIPVHAGAIIRIGKSVGKYAGATAGAGIGMRYYFLDHLGVNMEAGWLEMCVAKIGMAVKF
ncbi:MAG: hypothetical protein IPM95_04475 [Sphingobacteriales bacterium]|nr:hypothetical protein [Sphingobacteriales bacterium]